MTFLNWIILSGLATLAIPVIIHLVNRGRSRPIEWGAMQFLLASVASQSRRLLIEEMALLALRCLLLGLTVLAMARPFLPTAAGVPWQFVLPLTLAAIVCTGILASLWNRARFRRPLMLAIGGLLLAALASALLENRLQTRRWFEARGNRDICVIVDSSASMGLGTSGRSNFERAREEVQALLRKTRPGDAISLILAGPVPRVLIRVPATDVKTISDTVAGREFRLSGGAMATLATLKAATQSLSQGQSPEKKILFFTDGHSVDWDPDNEAAWQFLTQELGSFPVKPKLVCRRLPMPDSVRNAAVTELQLARRIVGTDRPVRIEVGVLNAGSVPLRPNAIELFIDGVSVAREHIFKELSPSASEPFVFEHQFAEPGRHILRAQIECEDDLPSDNVLEWVLDVSWQLPVLVVDGAPSERFFQGATAFISLALTPIEESRPVSTNAAARFLIRPRVVTAADLDSVTNLDACGAIILANVSRLPSRICDRLLEYVQNGGGLLIAPGGRAEPAFYNGWLEADGRPLMPAALSERLLLRKTPGRLSRASIAHPALDWLARSEQSDARSALVDSYWKLTPAGRETGARVIASLDNGSPFMVERRLGRGCVILAAIALDRRDSNLPSLRCFVPILHELVCHLALPWIVETNIRPGAGAVFDLPARTRPMPTPTNGFPQVIETDVLTPSGIKATATLTRATDRWIAEFTDTHSPGLYRLALPQFLQIQPGQGAMPITDIPFTVITQPEESTLTKLTDDTLRRLRERCNLVMASTSGELFTALGGGVPGQELWMYLAIGALLALLGETALTRWIAMQRRYHSTEPVVLPSAVDAKTRRQRADALLGAPHT